MATKKAVILKIPMDSILFFIFSIIIYSPYIKEQIFLVLFILWDESKEYDKKQKAPKNLGALFEIILTL